MGVFKALSPFHPYLEVREKSSTMRWTQVCLTRWTRLQVSQWQSIPMVLEGDKVSA
jgi:hypothetical protein